MSKRERRVSHAAAVLDRPTVPDDGSTAEHDAISQLAYELWKKRGSPIGSPEEDWIEAEKSIRQSDQ